MSRLKNVLMIAAFVILPVSLIANVLMYLRYSPQRAVIVVGSHKISKFDYEQALDQKAGKQVLNQMVFSELISQAASRANLVPTEAQVDARLAEIEQMAPQALQTAASRTLSSADRANLRTQMEMENLQMQNIKASDAEVTQYYNAHQAVFSATPQTVSVLVVTQKSDDAASAEHLLSLGLTPEAIARQPKMHVNGLNGFSVNTQALPGPLQRKIQLTLFAMKPGSVKTFPAGPYYLTFKAVSHQRGRALPLSEVRGLIERQVRLQKAPDSATELAQLYQREAPQILNAHYAPYFQDINQIPVPRPHLNEK